MVDAGSMVTRQEMIAMAVRSLGVIVEESLAIPAADADDVSEWARGDVAYALTYSMLNYRNGAPPDGYALPLADATRAEAAMALCVMLNTLTA